MYVILKKRGLKVGSQTNIKKGKNFYLYIYREISRGRMPNDIRGDNYLNTGKREFSKQNMTYYLNFLSKKVKIIKRVDPKNVYLGWKVLKRLSDDDFKALFEKEVKKRGKKKASIGTRGLQVSEFNLHALHIKIPILKGVVNIEEWDTLQEKFNNWIPHYKKEKALGGLTLKNNNNKSISIYVHPRNFDPLDLHFEEKLAFKVKVYAQEYFKSKHSVILDIWESETKNIDIAKDEKELKGKLRKGEKFSYDLGYKAKKIFPNDNMDAKVWLDSSPFPQTRETNDLDYKEAVVLSPLLTREIHGAVESIYSKFPAMDEYNKALADYAENIKLHMAVMEDIRQTERANLETQKQIQTVLGELKTRL